MKNQDRKLMALAAVGANLSADTINNLNADTHMNLNKNLLEKQIKTLSRQLDKSNTDEDIEDFEALLNFLGDLAETKKCLITLNENVFTLSIVLESNSIDRDIIITSKDATEQFELHDLDIDFIQQDIWDNNAVSGEMEVNVDEGLITINWKIMEYGK